jgi:methylated-DNA-protein-cysteine methyltransferase-like protein
MDEDLVEGVLTVVEAIPRGQICSYGDIAELLGVGPRQVGAVMSQLGGGVCWWRVTNAKGELPMHLLDEARGNWMAEGITLSSTGRGVRISAHRVDLMQIAAAIHDTMEP